MSPQFCLLHSFRLLHPLFSSAVLHSPPAISFFRFETVSLSGRADGCIHGTAFAAESVFLHDGLTGQCRASVISIRSFHLLPFIDRAESRLVCETAAFRHCR